MEKSVKHYSIPVFVPHEGCPNTCLFCNQRKISGKSTFSLNTVRDEIQGCLSTLPEDGDIQIAFFGGSFTAIDPSLMLSLLRISDEYVESGRVKSVRLSTRPDALSEEIFDILSQHHVEDIELGIQSLDDEVLLKNARGHTARCALDAMDKVVEHGFRLTGQMMTGMYCSGAESEIKTAHAIVRAGAVSTRIYPTVVFRATGLEQKLVEGEFVPLTLEESIERTLAVYKVFKKAGVKVLRIGLCSSEGVRGEDAVSVYHEAMGELVRSRDVRDEMEKLIERNNYSAGAKVEIDVPPKQMSLYVGQKKANKTYLEEKFNIKLRFNEEK